MTPCRKSTVRRQEQGGMPPCHPKRVFAIDVLIWIMFLRLDGETQSIFVESVTKADVIHCAVGAIGNDIQVEPRRIPSVTVLEVIGVALGVHVVGHQQECCQ